MNLARRVPRRELLRRSVRREPIDTGDQPHVHASPVSATRPAADQDGIVHFSGVSWEDYERLLVMRGDHSAPRIAYLEGDVVIMSPSQTHESIKSLIGCLVETYCLERDIVF